jgi:predicted ATP-grasp superfamily ATP-dependent carboligase
VRILVHEFFSGGGLAGRDVPASLAREGSAMLRALVADLAAIGVHHIVTTRDPRFPLEVPAGVDVVAMTSTRGDFLDALLASVDAVWLVAPETNRCLERLTGRAERKGVALLGSGSAAIRRASNKAALPRLLAQHGVSHPKTRMIDPSREDWKAGLKRAARELGYPLVVKPARGAGCEGVSLVRDSREFRQAVSVARQIDGVGRLVLQRYVRGVAASVSLVADGRRAVALTTNAQWIGLRRDFKRGNRAGVPSRPFSYRGGTTPLDHPLAARASEEAVRACEAIPGLRGYIGVDLVLTKSEAVVIEVNPRLTTAYLGVRSVLHENVAAMVLAACGGTLPEPSRSHRSVRFTTGGRIADCGVEALAV